MLAIGGLREKTLAAYCAGVKTVLIPADNLPNLEDVDPVVRRELEFIPVKTADEVLTRALVRPETVVGFMPIADPVATSAVMRE